MGNYLAEIRVRGARGSRWGPTPRRLLPSTDGEMVGLVRTALAGNPPAGRIDNRAADNQCGTHDPCCRQQRRQHILVPRNVNTVCGSLCGFLAAEFVFINADALGLG